MQRVNKTMREVVGLAEGNAQELVAAKLVSSVIRKLEGEQRQLYRPSYYKLS